MKYYIAIGTAIINYEIETDSKQKLHNFDLCLTKSDNTYNDELNLDYIIMQISNDFLDLPEIIEHKRNLKDIKITSVHFQAITIFKS